MTVRMNESVKMNEYLRMNEYRLVSLQPSELAW